MNPQRRFLILAILLVVALSGVAIGSEEKPWAPNPRLDWQELNAEHARVLYTPDLAEAARIAAAAASRAHKRWQQRLGATPPTTPTIVLSDRRDRPRSRIEVLPQPVIYLDHPVPRSTDDWTTLHGSGLVDQVFKAYGQLVDQTRVGGFSEDLRAVVGSIAAPGVVKPLYLREGLALANGDNVDTAMPDMAVRAWRHAGTWPTLAGLSAPHTGADGLPVGTAAGALGAAWLQQIPQERQDPIHQRLSELYAERPLIPLIADPLFVTAGLSSEGYYQELVEAARQRDSAGPAAERISPSGRSLDPAWAPDGTALAYRHEHAERRVGLRLATADGTTDQALIDGQIGPPAWSRIQSGPTQTTTLVYPKAHLGPNGRHVMDLFEYRLNSEMERRLTTDERIEAVAAFPNDPNRFLVTRSEPDLGQSLMVLELIRNAEGEVQDTVRQILRTFDASTRVLSMDVAPDGERFALSIWRRSTGTDLVMLDRWGQRMTTLVSGPSEARDPAFSPDGRWLLYADDRAGIPQVFARNLDTDATFRVTQAPAGAFDPSVSPTGTQLAYVGYGTAGFTIRTSPYDPSNWTRIDSSSNGGQETEADNRRSIVNEDVTTTPYRPGTDLIPSYWMPLVTPNQVGIQTRNADPLGQHAYSLSLGLGISPLDLRYAFEYTNERIRPALNVRFRGGPTGSTESVRLRFPLQIELGRTRSLTLGWRHTADDNRFFLEGRLSDIGGIGRFERTSRVRVEGTLIGTPQSPSYRLELRWQEDLRLPLSSEAGAHRLSVDVQAAWSDTDQFRLGGARGPYPLRGAPRGVAVGHQLARASFDYRVPVWRLQWACCGATPWPVFLDTLASSLFVDIGTAGDELNPAEATLSAGAEFRLDISLGYGLVDATLRAGLAYRFDTDAPKVFVNLGPRF
ncbi:MAG: hypothetical protein ABEK03_08425 [Candidatus Bipolaricaulia bacterium]